MVRNADPGIKAISITAPQQILQRTIPPLERQIDDAVAAKPEAVDFLMSQVQMIDSAGMNWLLSVQARLETLGMRMRVVDPSAIVSDMLMATRLDSRFTIQISAEAAGAVHGGG